MAIIAAASVFVSVYLLVMAFAGPGHDAVRARVALIGLGRASGEAKVPSFGERIIGPILDVAAERFFALLPQSFVMRLRARLERAGEPTTLEGYLIITALAAAVLSGLGLAVGIAMYGGVDSKVLGIAVVMAGVGVFLPTLWLKNRINQRRTAIIKALPDSFDLITTCVEAGLGLDAALARVAEKVEGPFAEELSKTLREIGMGRSRAEALRDLAERTAIPDLSIFVNAIIQAEQMGTSIGQVLRVQSEQMRTRRRQRAEELANQAPVKMIFPLVLCIFPTLFIVILGPAVIQLYETYMQ
ncbi:MAG: type II secretion system F family protein [Dehalococcoidia bacterium]|nr:type II secretion system F family protein [Dehalococcoidia bacterium]